MFQDRVEFFFSFDFTVLDCQRIFVLVELLHCRVNTLNCIGKNETHGKYPQRHLFFFFLSILFLQSHFHSVHIIAVCAVGAFAVRFHFESAIFIHFRRVWRSHLITTTMTTRDAYLKPTVPQTTFCSKCSTCAIFVF